MSPTIGQKYHNREGLDYCINIQVQVQVFYPWICLKNYFLFHRLGSTFSTKFQLLAFLIWKFDTWRLPMGRVWWACNFLLRIYSINRQWLDVQTLYVMIRKLRGLPSLKIIQHSIISFYQGWVCNTRVNVIFITFSFANTCFI